MCYAHYISSSYAEGCLFGPSAPTLLTLCVLWLDGRTHGFKKNDRDSEFGWLRYGQVQFGRKCPKNMTDLLTDMSLTYSPSRLSADGLTRTACSGRLVGHTKLTDRRMDGGIHVYKIGLGTEKISLCWHHQRCCISSFLFSVGKLHKCKS